ncbi:homoserine O-acetyltransferase [Candidatus Saccharibacteria bacterium]|nr:homoserine O-acetyltransferase [Candidatus Saccharibacteria bacterium]
MEKNLGNVETKYFELGELVVESGKKLESVKIAYETYGQLNEKRNNAILIEHAFSGDAHAAGWHDCAKKPGWWDNMIGPGKAFDTDRYFVICSNVLGGCSGTTGPSSLNLVTGRNYGSDFPSITISDIVSAQERLIDFLGIDRLLAVAGGSMGGMQALQWAIDYPNKIRAVIPIAATMKHSPQQIAFNYVQRQSIIADPNWNGGNYYCNDKKPNQGLANARMLGHITYMSDQSMQRKFARQTKGNFFQVENYLRYNGDKFTGRFDANSYLYLTEAMDNFDVSKRFVKADATTAKFLVISFQSDWLYPSSQSAEIARELKSKDYDVEHIEIESTYGHDAFLLEAKEQAKIIQDFLVKVSCDKLTLTPCEKSPSLLK